MNAKEEILSRYRASVGKRFDMPSLDDIDPITWEDPVRQFEASLAAAGGRSSDVPAGADVNEVIRGLFPDSHSFASNIEGLSIATVNPDTIADVRELDGLDVGIVRGEVGVAENACVWVPQTMKEKAVCFICEHLVILLDPRNIVNNMHEAYRRIEMNDYGYGTFISGPSKTADIAQVLVMGAQAARSVTVIFVG